MCVSAKKIKYDNAPGVTGVASHGKHTRSHRTCEKIGEQNFQCYPKNVGSCPLPGS